MTTTTQSPTDILGSLTDRSAATAIAAARQHLARCGAAGSTASGMAQAVGASGGRAETIRGRLVPDRVRVALDGDGSLSVEADGRVLLDGAEATEEQIAALPRTRGTRCAWSPMGGLPGVDPWVGLA